MKNKTNGFAESSARQRKYDKYASYLLFVSFGLSVFFNYCLKEGYFAYESGQKGYIIHAPVILVIYYLIGKGQKWVKIVFLVLYGLVTVVSFVGYQATLAVEFATPLNTVSYVSQTILEIFSCVLILIGFKRPKQARESRSML